jgi:hypothetical protein
VFDGLISTEERNYMFGSHSLEGADLDIGGEYHKLIYDQVLTAQAKKIGKKHGAKVEEGGVIATDLDKMRKAYQENYVNQHEIHNINDEPGVFADELETRRNSPEVTNFRDFVVVDSNGEYLRHPRSGEIVFFEDVAHAQDELNYAANRVTEQMTDKEILEFYEDADEAAEKVWSMRLTDKLKQAYPGSGCAGSCGLHAAAQSAQ